MRNAGLDIAVAIEGANPNVEPTRIQPPILILTSLVRRESEGCPSMSGEGLFDPATRAAFVDAHVAAAFEESQ
jgi:hypothetical protein